ncbi:unnamed protein product, partial [Didymodactylos carnosus]
WARMRAIKLQPGPIRPVNKIQKRRPGPWEPMDLHGFSQPPQIIRPIELEVQIAHRSSFTRAEEKLTSSFEPITYRPSTKWTNQLSTKELLEKKIDLRNQFTYEIDFTEYKEQFLTNAAKKLDGLTAFGLA